MNLLDLLAFGTSEGVEKGWESRPRATLKLKRYSREVFDDYGNVEIKYTIHDETGKRVGILHTHGENDGKTVFVDWVHLDGREVPALNPMPATGARAILSIAHQLKDDYPEAEEISGDRVTGIHKRVATEKGWRHNIVTVPLHAAANFMWERLG